MNWLSRLFGRGEDDESPVVEKLLDQEARRAQLAEFSTAMDALMTSMQEPPAPVDNPGWRGRYNDLGYVRDGAATLSTSVITRGELMDLLTRLRPLFSGPPPEGLEHIGALSDRVIALARAMEAPLASE